MDDEEGTTEDVLGIIGDDSQRAAYYVSEMTQKWLRSGDTGLIPSDLRRVQDLLTEALATTYQIDALIRKRSIPPYEPDDFWQEGSPDDQSIAVRDGFTAFIYIGADDAVQVLWAIDEYQHFLSEIGLRFFEFDQIGSGSLWTTIKGRWKSSRHAKTVTQKTAKAVAEAEAYAMSITDKAQANTAQLQANALAQVLQAAPGHDMVCIFPGFVAIRLMNDGKPQLMNRPLSSEEQIVLEENPGIATNPRNFFPDLATALEAKKQQRELERSQNR